MSQPPVYDSLDNILGSQNFRGWNGYFDKRLVNSDTIRQVLEKINQRNESPVKPNREIHLLSENGQPEADLSEGTEPQEAAAEAVDERVEIDALLVDLEDEYATLQRRLDDANAQLLAKKKARANFEKRHKKRAKAEEQRRQQLEEGVEKVRREQQELERSLEAELQTQRRKIHEANAKKKKALDDVLEDCRFLGNQNHDLREEVPRLQALTEI